LAGTWLQLSFFYLLSICLDLSDGSARTLVREEPNNRGFSGFFNEKGQKNLQVQQAPRNAELTASDSIRVLIHQPTPINKQIACQVYEKDVSLTRKL
jgi:hypothetical protein